LKADRVWLARFGDKNWRHHLRRWTQDYKFEKTLKPRLDIEEQRWHAAQPLTPTPVIIHELPDDELQTGESRKLGGAMEIKSPWSDQ
jgi:hypothetical protein